MPPLCSACCSGIRQKASETFFTNCCNKPVCDNCLEANPRLRYYSPCLSCCGAIQVVGSSDRDRTESIYNSPRVEQQKKDADAFVIGEDEDDQELSDVPASTPIQAEGPTGSEQVHKDTESQPESGREAEHGAPLKYWLRKGDTLNGIALRFKVNAREICKLNGLLPSTITTTPHLLHTRSFLILPPTNIPPPPPPADLKEKEEQRKRERAAKQFQFVTKEVDWGIAKTYVALAEENEAGLDDEYNLKRKEAGHPVRQATSQGSSAGGAVERYLDDQEWEEEQLKAGAKPKIQPFPFLTAKA